MTDEELRQLVASNAKAIEVMLDAMVEARQEREQLQERMVRLQDVVVPLTNLQEGISNLLVALDEDRPTILRKLTSIESKIDRLLEPKKQAEEH